MRKRLKLDKVVFDQRKYNLEKELRHLKKQREAIVVDRNEQELTDDRTNKVYKKYVDQLEKEQEEREEHLRNVECMIEEKQRVSRVNDFRSRELKDIAEKAMQDKDGNEKTWQRIFLTNSMLSTLLKCQM
jgi:arginyl-tRNA--protein-N-Asp/Glu arginylyltransferase